MIMGHFHGARCLGVQGSFLAPPRQTVYGCCLDCRALHANPVWVSAEESLLEGEPTKTASDS
jgi:hypothetical protein